MKISTKNLESRLQVIQVIQFGRNQYLIYEMYMQSTVSCTVWDITDFVLWSATFSHPTPTVGPYLKFGDVPLKLNW